MNENKEFTIIVFTMSAKHTTTTIKPIEPMLQKQAGKSSKKNTYFFQPSKKKKYFDGLATYETINTGNTLTIDTHPGGHGSVNDTVVTGKRTTVSHITGKTKKERHYSYISATYLDPEKTGMDALMFRKFIVGTPFKKEATARAQIYCMKKWGRAPDELGIYPRNYYGKAKELFKAGLHD